LPISADCKHVCPRMQLIGRCRATGLHQKYTQPVQVMLQLRRTVPMRGQHECHMSDVWALRTNAPPQLAYTTDPDASRTCFCALHTSAERRPSTGKERAARGAVGPVRVCIFETCIPALVLQSILQQNSSARHTGRACDHMGTRFRSLHVSQVTPGFHSAAWPAGTS
jgi:hypothetical protein